MKKIVTLISMSILAAFGAAGADQTPGRPVEKPADKAAEPVKIDIKNKSSFAMDAASRNPFWPIGWKPAKLAESRNDQAGPEIPASAFVLSTITLDQGTRFAIINGKTMQEGQQFGLQLGTQTYQITLKAIQDGRVILTRRDQEIIVPLRRK